MFIRNVGRAGGMSVVIRCTSGTNYGLESFGGNRVSMRKSGLTSRALLFPAGQAVRRKFVNKILLKLNIKIGFLIVWLQPVQV